jgi:hypothetical protein
MSEGIVDQNVVEKSKGNRLRSRFREEESERGNGDTTFPGSS